MDKTLWKASNGSNGWI